MLTEKRINEIRDKIKHGDGWDGDAWDHALAKAIEAEVRAETMEAEQGMRFPESSDLAGGETDCNEVRAEAQEPITYLYRDMNSGGKSGALKVCHITPCDRAFPVYVSPQPPAPCPNCLGQEPDDLILRDEYIKAEREVERLQSKVAELAVIRRNAEESNEVLRRWNKELQAKLAEQSAEFDRLTLQRDNCLRVGEERETYIKDLEQTREQQTTLLAKCKRALQYHTEMTRPLGNTDEVLRLLEP
jgi:hypothetical protein